MRLINQSSLTPEPVSHDQDIMKTVFLRDNVVPSILYLSQAAIPSGKSTTEHSHTDMIEVFMVISGRGEVTINDAKYPVGAGSCVVIEPGERHILTCIGESPLEITYFGVSSELRAV